MSAPVDTRPLVSALRGRRSGATEVRELAPWKRKVARILAPYLFVSPAFVLFTVFICLPLIGTILISFTNWPLLGQPHLNGLSNFRTLLHDSVLADALRNTFLFTLLTVVVHMVLGLALALAVTATHSRVVRYITRTAFFAPFLMSSGVVALLWGGLLNYNFGPIPYYLQSLGIHLPDVLNSNFWVVPSLVLVDVWATIGISFLIFLVGLQSIPETLHEAARIDGAGRWAAFWHVTIPMLSPTMLFASLTSFIGAFQIFTWMDVITNGGPGNSSLSMVQYVYRSAFQNLQLGYGASVGVVVLLILIVVSGVQFVASRWWVHYERT